MDVITHNTRIFSLTIVTQLLCKALWKRFSFYFPFTPWRRYHRFIKFVEIIHPRSLSQLWRNSSQLARLFKLNVALSPDRNTARWFARMDLSASVHKQQGRLSASAVKPELAMPWKWTIQAFWQNVFRVQIALYVENNAWQSAHFFFKVAFIGFCKWTLHILNNV